MSGSRWSALTGAEEGALEGTATGSSLDFFGANGRIQLSVTLDDRSGPFIVFEDGASRHRMSLVVDPDGHPSIVLRDAHDQPRRSLGLSDAGPLITVTDEIGQTRMSLGVYGDGLPSIRLKGKHSKAGVSISIDESKGEEINGETPIINLHDRSGNTRLAAFVPGAGPVVMLSDARSSPRARLSVAHRRHAGFRA